MNAIVVANGNVYAAGFDQIAEHAVLWTNGTPTPLLDGTFSGAAGNPPYTTYAASLLVSGSDVYVAGFAQKALQIAPNTYWDANVAVYWKNGVPTDLSQVTNQGPNTMATSIAVSGSDVYVAGNIQSSIPLAVYWKNGTQVPLPNTGLPTSASSIAVSGSNVYVAGNVNGGASGYWTNGTPTPFSNTNPGLPVQIAVNGTDVYAAGDTALPTVNNNYVAAYWKNGTRSMLSTSAAYSNAFGIALAPQP